MFGHHSKLPTLAAVITAAAIAACGSSSSGTTNSSSSGPTQAQIQHFQTDAIKFTGCMRAHGIADFPDPPTMNNPSSGRTWKSTFANQSPGFAAAMATCQHFMPLVGAHSQNSTPSRAQIAAMLAFARCIRSHGFANFPDPTADACVGVTHGFITEAVVARFIAGQ